MHGAIAKAARGYKKPKNMAKRYFILINKPGSDETCLKNVYLSTYWVNFKNGI